MVSDNLARSINFGSRLTGVEQVLMSFPVHTAAEALRFVGLRDRLRCPSCHAVGTFKPHGSIIDREDRRRVRRWLCKWCGYYLGPEGRRVAYCDPVAREWRLPENTESRTTPSRAIAGSQIPNAWPWRG
jgi:rubredoxin